MDEGADIARLNVLLELFSECARATELDGLVAIATRRLRWVVDFDRCVIVHAPGSERRCWVAVRTSEALATPDFADLPAPEAELILRALASGAPALLPPGLIAVPMEDAARTIGALVFFSRTTRFTHRDLRLGHHAGQYLGTLVARIELEV